MNKIYRFKVYSSVALSFFTFLCNRHHYPSPSLCFSLMTCLKNSLLHQEHLYIVLNSYFCSSQLSLNYLELIFVDRRR